MDEHEALKQAQEQVKAPKKDKTTGDWVVEYLNNGHWVRETFSSDEAAYVYHHTKVAKFKTYIMTQTRGER